MTTLPRLLFLILLVTAALLERCPIGARTGLREPTPRPPATPVPPPVGDRIVYARGVTTSNHEIFMTQPDTAGNGTQLTNHLGDDWHPALSPDGRQIAFVTQRDWPPGPLALYVMSDAGTDLRFVVGPDRSVYIDRVAWSPDGATLAYSWRGGIWTIPAAGGSPNRVTPADMIAWNPTWNPGGNEIAFERQLSAVSNRIWGIRPDGSGLRQLSRGAADEQHPDWGPDPDVLLFSSGNAVFRLQISTGAATLVLPDAQQPASSPDGRRMAFVRSGQIWVANADGTNAVRLTDGPNDRDPDWAVSR
jgi:Tol biopolymer transport system component